MNEKFNKNAKVEKFTNMMGIALRLIVIDPCMIYYKSWFQYLKDNGYTRGIWKVMHIHLYNFTQWSEKKDEGISVNVRIWGF